MSQGLVAGLTAAFNVGAPPLEPIVRSRNRLTPEEVLEGLRSDFVEREYLWSGQITDELYAKGRT